MNVLITSASRKVALVRSFQRAIARVSPGGRVIAADINANAAALYAADQGHLLPRSDSPEFMSALVKLCQEKEIRLVVPTRDEELPLFAEQRQRLIKAGVVVMVAQPSVIRQCQDKRAFLRFCERNGFGFPPCVPQTAWGLPESYPLFFRPCFGKAGVGSRRINSSPELDAALAKSPEGVVQEFVEAPEYTIDLFADFAGEVISVVPRRRISVWGGESFVSRTEKHPVLIAESVRLAKRLGLVGHNTIQCFLRDDQPLFIEVNARFGGAANLSIAAGADSPQFLLTLLTGQALESRLGQFADQLTMLRYTEDFFLPPERLLKLTS